MSIQRLLAILARFDSRDDDHFPPLLVLSDTARQFSLQYQVQAWPPGTAMIERTYGHKPTPSQKGSQGAMRLATCTPAQARQAGIDGIHWPNKRLRLRKKSNLGGLIETASAHSSREIAKARRLGIKNVMLSPAFFSKSASAGKPLGAVRMAILRRRFPDVRIFALGGITSRTAKRLISTRVYGVALVGFGN